MSRSSVVRERWIGIFLLGLAAFSPPLIIMFGSGGTLAGIPVLFVYMFGAWGALILLMRLTAEHRFRPEGEARPDRGDGDGDPDGA